MTSTSLDPNSSPAGVSTLAKTLETDALAAEIRIKRVTQQLLPHSLLSSSATILQCH